MYPSQKSGCKWDPCPSSRSPTYGSEDSVYEISFILQTTTSTHPHFKIKLNKKVWGGEEWRGKSVKLYIDMIRYLIVFFFSKHVNAFCDFVFRTYHLERVPLQFLWYLFPVCTSSFPYHDDWHWRCRDDWKHVRVAYRFSRCNKKRRRETKTNYR